MMSKNLFFKLQQEDIKRRLWTIALSVLVFFFSFPVVCAMYLGNYNTEIPRDQILQDISRFIGLEYEFALLITVVAAIICGLSGHFYLHSRKKVDLYHSIPIRRELLFAISYINGVLIYLIPYIINVLFCFIVLQVNGFMSAQIFTTALAAIVVNLLFYCLIYTIVIIAVMLTGNIIISCLGTAVFLMYGPMIMLLKESLFRDFFTTYYVNNRLQAKMLFLFPIGIYVDTANKIVSGMNQATSLRVLAVLIVTALLLGFAVYLYKKRPSEAAGQAMSFDNTKPVIKFLLVIPLSLAGGIIFKEIANRGSDGWFVFGLIFSIILVYAIIEIIYNFDIRSAFNYKKQLIACAGIVAATACIFQFDLINYDSYIPNKDNIQSMSVAFSGVDENLQYLEFESGKTIRTNGDQYQLKYMDLTNFDTAYALAQLGLNRIDRDIDDEHSYNYTVKYTMENGSEIFRTYSLTTDETYDMMKEIYSSPEFRQAHFPIYKLDVLELEDISCYNMLERKEFGLNIAEKNQLLELYKEELLSLSLDQVANSKPVATLSIDANEHYTLDYYVYPAFNKTIAFLKEHGFDATKEVTVKDIKRIVVNNYQAPINDNDNNPTIEASKYEHQAKTYIDENEISEIFPLLIEDEYYNSNRSIINAHTDIEVVVDVNKDEYGNEGTYHFYFKEGSIPDFVKKDVRYTEQ